MGRYTTRHLARRGVELIIGDGVTRIDGDGIALHSGTQIASATVVWSAGVRPSPVLRDLPGVAHARNGGIVVNEDMSVAGRPGVWALGDSAWIPSQPGAELSDKDAWYPATAQHAIREGPVLADNLVATLRGKPTKPFRYTSLGTMASLGGRRGVAALPGGFVLTGFHRVVPVARLLPRAAAGAGPPGAGRVRLGARRDLPARHRRAAALHRARPAASRSSTPASARLPRPLDSGGPEA